MKNWRKFLGPLAGILLSLVFLGLALMNVKPGDIAAALRTADYRLVALSAVFTLTSYVLRTARWGQFLRSQKQVPIRRLFPVLVIGFTLNNLLPARPGEFARAISLGQREGLSKTLGLATVFVERVADGLTLIAILALISFGFDLPGWGQQTELVSLVIFAVALGGILLLLWRESLATRLFSWGIHFLPARFAERLNKMFSSFILGLHALRSPRDILAIVLLSLAIWLCEGMHYFLILSAFGFFDALSTRTLAAGFTMVIANLSISIPAAPGGVGPFEWAGSLALKAFGIPAGPALSAVLISHMVQFVVVTALGLVFIAREGVKLTQAVEQET